MPKKSRSRSRRVCSKSKSHCTKAGLKAELKRRGYSKGTLARLGNIGVKTKSGRERTKSALINAIMKYRVHTVARKLGITLVSKRRHLRKHK